MIGRKRPSYDNYPESEKDNSGRKSFISGHSSLSFVIATYSSLFVYEHTGDNTRTFDIALKSTAITASFCAAGFTAWSRVDDNRHHVSDVIAGSAAGIFSGVAGYIHQNGWLAWNQTEENISLLPIFTGDDIYIALIKKI
jgi:membrane-associated phospholipid phosphatase